LFALPHAAVKHGGFATLGAGYLGFALKPRSGDHPFVEQPLWAFVENELVFKPTGKKDERDCQNGKRNHGENGKDIHGNSFRCWGEMDGRWVLFIMLTSVLSSFVLAHMI